MSEIDNTIKAMKWGDNDRYFGPFTWSYSDAYPHFAVVLSSSGGGGDHDLPCSLRVSIGKATLIARLPNIVGPWREKVFPKWDAETVRRLGRDWYWNVEPRQYGVTLSEGHLSVKYGRASIYGSAEQQWGCFLPWTQWRHIRHSLYGVQGEHFWTESDSDNWPARHAARDACPTVKFAIEDFDGAKIVATTRIEEREWRFGTGLFKWLSLFRRAKIRRYLEIGFSAEVGPEKGSWKGGVIGTSIEMLPGETHEQAFQRFCAEEHRSKSRKYVIRYVSPHD